MTTPAAALAEAAREALPALTEDLRRLVHLDTPSDDKALLDAGLDAIRGWLRERLGEPDEETRHEGGVHGDVLEALYGGAAPGTVLVVCHYDTVWPAGTPEEWPFSVDEDGRATGPGLFDMKTGLAQAVWAVALLDQLGLPRPAVRFLINGDEEIGSPASRPYIERASEGALATFICEASHHGALKTARKGVGLFEVEVTGVEAHAGLDPDAGASAIHALAELVPVIAGAGDRDRGTTLNVGLISGGTGRNVVAGRALCGIDVRVAEPGEMARVDAVLSGLTASDPRVKVSVTGAWNRPPMVPTPASRQVFALAQEVGAELGVTVEEVGVGGASDGNFVSALGRPVLDGLGAVGDGAHARHEHILLGHVPERTALTAGLLHALGVAGTD
ncbi:M20 family metallopeptidase [Streptomyces albiaxialis]|uniref:M20 family metallopeptidase n=1 Tax=Streptomyces albiaxialis TaxID=329523 RepID=A0ABP5IAU0_9ACTN